MTVSSLVVDAESRMARLVAKTLRVMIEVRTCTLSSVLAQSTMRKPKIELKKSWGIP